MMDSSIPSSILEGVPVPVDTSHLASQVVSVAAATAPPVHAISIQVGDLFPDMKAFRARLGLFGITNKCPYRARRSDNSRFVGVCPTVMNELKQNKEGNRSSHTESKEPCPFHVIARRRKEGGVFVTRAILMHSPDCAAPITFSTSATSAYMSQLMEDSASFIAPREIGKFVHEATGTKLSYSTLWRTSHQLQTKERERQDASFKLIVPFLNAFCEANPNTAAVVEQHSNGRFYRLFLCPGPTGSALDDCPSGVHVESMCIRSCYEGYVLLAYAKDGLGALLPIAMAITPQADEDNWRFFFHQLLAALPVVSYPSTTISYDKDMSIHAAQISVLPASRSTTDASYVDWSSSGALSEFHAQMTHLCAGSYYSIMVGWITHVAVLMYARCVELDAEHSVFPGDLLSGSAVALGWDVASFGPSDYLVVNAREKQQVNLAIRSCSCGHWLDQAFPCVHAIRCLPLERLVNPAQFVHPSYFTESLRRCYSRRLMLINTNSIKPQGSSATPGNAAYLNEQGPEGGAGVALSAELPLLPPTSFEPVKRGRGRPRVVRTSSGRASGVGSGYQCGHCHGKGHNSRTCPMNPKDAARSTAAVPGTTADLSPPAPSPVTLGAAAPSPNVFVDSTVPFTLDSSLSTSTTTV